MNEIDYPRVELDAVMRRWDRLAKHDAYLKTTIRVHRTFKNDTQRRNCIVRLQYMMMDKKVTK